MIQELNSKIAKMIIKANIRLKEKSFEYIARIIMNIKINIMNLKNKKSILLNDLNLD